MKNLETIIERVQSEINRVNKGIEPLTKKMNENFLMFFDFDRPEKLFKLTYKKYALEVLFGDLTLQKLTDLKESNEFNIKDLLQNRIDYYTRELMNGRYQNNSTSTFNNLAFVYRKEVDAELLSFYKNCLRFITSDDKYLIF